MKSPYAKETVESGFAAGKPEGKGFTLRFILILAAVLGVLAYSKYDPSPPTPPDYIDDDVVIVDPVIDDKDDTEKIDLKDSYLVRVYETEADQCPTWLVNLLNNDSFWFDWLKERDMRLFTFDPSSNADQSQTFVDAAKAKGIDPPFIIHAKAGKVLSITQFEEQTTTEQLQKTVLSKGK